MVIRRVAAAIVLLAAAVLLHFTTPHHTTDAPSAVSAMAPAIEPETRKASGPATVLIHADTGLEHHETAADAPARLPRALAPDVESHASSDGTPVDEVTIAAVPSGTAQPRTARETWNPSGALTPTPSTLQTFRC
ncbi:hypothetical protein OG800_11975 [Streptomyces sp. NBC_00445]|uniref:hypothetical protein n=1 Tax=unclassified Streptomyces TaxID=2593676 RepID=UPI002E1DD9A0|nr:MULTISPECIES: hypothetical protein [unclassified Streptomyces]